MALGTLPTIPVDRYGFGGLRGITRPKPAPAPAPFDPRAILGRARGILADQDPDAILRALRERGQINSDTARATIRGAVDPILRGIAQYGQVSPPGRGGVQSPEGTGDPRWVAGHYNPADYENGINRYNPMLGWAESTPPPVGGPWRWDGIEGKWRRDFDPNRPGKIKGEG